MCATMQKLRMRGWDMAGI
jgi:hypothetical protein